MVKKIFHSSLYLFLCFGLLACNMPSSGAPQATPEQATPLPPPSDTPIPTVTEAPSETATPAATATETETPEPTTTPTIAVPIAEVFRETNCRTGPAGNYDLVVVIAAGTMVEVTAQDLGAGYYWYIRNPENPEQGCWLLAQNAKVAGDTSELPAFTPMPSPTSAPAFKVTFKNFDICKGSYFARFVVTNTGDVQFRSAYIKVTNTKTNEVQEQSLNAFDLTEGCIIAQNVAPLLPGKTGHLDSPRFNKDPRSHRLTAVIMVCTEQNLRGVCVTQTLDVKP